MRTWIEQLRQLSQCQRRELRFRVRLQRFLVTRSHMGVLCVRLKEEVVAGRGVQHAGSDVG